MNQRPILSIIIPVYNAADYLPQCLDSILAAELENTEIILVDDGSKDESLSVCCGYEQKHPNIRVFHQENAGPSRARNHGLEEAKGEYVAFLDSDDYIDSSAFAHRVELLKQYEADVWFSDFHRVADNGCVLDQVYQIREIEEPILDKEYLTEFLSHKECVWNAVRCIFRRSFLLEHDLKYPEGFHCAEDLYLMVRIFTTCQRFAFYHEPYYNYRITYDQSLTRNYSLTRVRHVMTMLRRAEECLKEDQASEILGAKLAKEYIFNLALLYAVPKENYRETLHTLKEGKHLLCRASGVYALAARFVDIFGIRVTGWILNRLKRLKQLVRNLKEDRYRKTR